MVQAVTQASSSATISATPNPAIYLQPVTLQYQVAAAAPSQATISGTCTLTIDGVNSACAMLDSTGSASQTAEFAAGAHTFTVTYAGNANIKGSSGAATLTVNKGTPSGAAIALHAGIGFQKQVRM